MHTLHDFTSELSRIESRLAAWAKEGKKTRSQQAASEVRKQFSELHRAQASRLLCCVQPGCHQPCSLSWRFHLTKYNTFSDNALLLTRPLGCFLLFHPVVIGGVVPAVREADPRACDANAGVTVVVITDPSSREVGCPPGLGKFAHHAGCHGAVTLGRHICRVSANKQDHKVLQSHLSFKSNSVHLL